MTPYRHAVSSARKFGGEAEDYLELHQWFDETKAYWPHFTHRALRHHSLGILQCEEKFGVYLLNSQDRKVPTRLVAEQHVQEDHGRIPTLQDWLGNLVGRKKWMSEPNQPKDYLDDLRSQWIEAVMFHRTELGFQEYRMQTGDTNHAA